MKRTRTTWTIAAVLVVIWPALPELIPVAGPAEAGHYVRAGHDTRAGHYALSYTLHAQAEEQPSSPRLAAPGFCQAPA